MPGCAVLCRAPALCLLTLEEVGAAVVQHLGSRVEAVWMLLPPVLPLARQPSARYAGHTHAASNRNGATNASQDSRYSVRRRDGLGKGLADEDAASVEYEEPTTASERGR